MSKVTVIIPAYNPDAAFVKLVKELVEEFDVLVINDGSKEECAPFFEAAVKAGAVLVNHEVNRGKGAALKTAISYMQGRGGEWVAVTADADGQHCIKDIRRVAELAVESPSAMVLGVRSFKGMPPRSRFGNTFTRVSFLLATGNRVSDTQTGLRSFSHLTADRLITAKGDRYEYEMNVLLNLKRWRIPVIETVIETIYIDGNASSHFHPIRDSLVVFSQVLKYAFSSIVCFVLDWLVFLALTKLVHLSEGWAFLGARAVSSALNYQLSARVVFGTKPRLGTVLGYYALVVCSACAGSLLVELLVGAGVNGVVSKLIVDPLLFILNFFVQKYLIFR